VKIATNLSNTSACAKSLRFTWEEGCILEIYNPTGEFLRVVTVPISSIEALSNLAAKTALTSA
jgi:hypothetical protein